MTILKCVVEKCTTEFKTDEPLSPSAKFVCKNHTSAAIRKTAAFQEFAFDPELDGENEENQAQEFDRDWGMSGKPMLSSEKCEHGVYDPTEDQRYCTICNSAKLVVVGRTEKTKAGKIVVLKNPEEQQDQAAALLLFYHTLPASLQPEWFKDKELGFKSGAKRAFTQPLKKNPNYRRDQFVEAK